MIDTLGLMHTLGGTRFGVRKLKQLANGKRQGRSRAISISNLGVTDKVRQAGSSPSSPLTSSTHPPTIPETSSTHPPTPPHPTPSSKVFLPTDRGFAIGKTQWGIDEGFAGHSIFLAVSSYQGALNFTLSYAPSIFTREMAQEFGEGCIECLLAASPPVEA